MSINVSALNIYNDELSYGLARKAMLEADDVKYFTLWPKVNGNLQLNTVSSTLFGTNDECGHSDTGTTVFAGNVLETLPITFAQDLCAKKAGRYWMGKYDAAVALGESFGSLEEVIMSEKQAVAEYELAKIRWQGNVTTGSGNLGLADGLLKVAQDLSATTVNVTKSAMTASNAITIVDAYAANVPAAIKAVEHRLFLSPADFDIYLVALRNANYFHFSPETTLSEIKHVGSRNLIVTSVNGLNGVASGTGIITTKDNMNLGTLDDAEAMNANLWYSKDENQVKYRNAVTMGVMYTFAEHVVRIA